MAPRDVIANRQQYAALPWRKIGRPEVMLISSRETKRWVIPKGWPVKDLLPHEAAAREAFEEAGIEGEISTSSFGHYHYLKRMKNGVVLPCRVDVFLFHVVQQLRDWPERKQRDTRWFPLHEAAAAVDESDLTAIINRFAAKHA